MMKRVRHTQSIAAALFVLVLALPVMAQQPAPSPRPERGFGPVTVVTKRGPVTARLLRRDADLLWIDQITSSGQYIETGVALSSIVNIETSRPKVFDMVDQAAGTGQIAQVQIALKRVSDILKPYRDLPGIPVDESLQLQARLLERTGEWKEALVMYEDLLRQKYAIKDVETIRLRRSLCHAKLSMHDELLAALDTAAIPDDDLNLQSELYFARAVARSAKGRHQDAVMDYLYLVVFNPYLLENEPRALSAAVTDYIAMKDWDAVAKTIGVLNRDYEGSEYTKRATAALASYEKELAEEAQFQQTE